MQKNFWVKNGALGENGCPKGLWVKIGVLGGNGHAKGPFGLKWSFRGNECTFGSKMRLWGKWASKGTLG